MGVIDRVARSLLESEVALERSHLRRAARRLLQEEAPLADETLVEEVVDGLVGLGPLELLLRDPSTSDVLVNGPDNVFVERDGALMTATVSFADDRSLVTAVERVIGPLGLRLDRASPMVDARLPDGSRLHAVIPPAAVDHPLVAIRRFIPAFTSLEALEEAASITKTQSGFLKEAIAGRLNIVVSGGTGTGKTTLLNVLGRCIPPDQRVVTIEDAAELAIPGHVVRLEARPPNAEGKGEITLRVLLRSALRLRPDRIILGEVRGAEALDMISALNTGHAGSMSTVHANSPEEALWRLETLALSGGQGVGETAVRRQLRSAVHLVVQLIREEGVRRVGAIAEVGSSGATVKC